MSIQTYNDIITIQPQKQDFQVSSQNKISQNSSSTSFAEMVALYRNENKSENVTEVKHEIDNVQKAESVKSDNDVKKSETVQKSENSEKKEVSEKVEKTEDKKVDEKGSVSEKLGVGKTETKNLVNKTDFQEKTPLKNGKIEKSEDGKKVSEKANKKIDKKEFARFSQITETAANNVEKAEIAAANVEVKTVNLKNQNFNVEIDGEKENSDLSVDLVLENSQAENLIAMNQNIAAENDEQEMDFDLNLDQKETSGKKVSKLDKEGKITVEDFRSKLDAEPKTVNEENEPKLKADLEITGENTATITMDMAQNAQNDILSLNNQTAASDGSNFRAMLNNQIQNNAPEFVKAGNIILKDNNQGTIDLVLHPDDLGNVKIHLSLDGKNLTGHITVATKEALEVFKDNAETLREAFIKSGFEAASFDVAYGNNNSGFGQNGEFTNQNDGRGYVAHQVYGSLSGSDDSEAGVFFENSSDLENYSINIVA